MPKTISLSASSISTFMSCRRKYYFQYIEQLQPIVRAVPLSFGSAVHAGLEHMFKAGDQSKDGLIRAVEGSYSIDELNESGVEPYVAVETILAFANAVDWKHWQFWKVEPWFEVMLGHGRKLRGRFDGIIDIDGSLFILEHKTVAGAVTERRLNHLLWDQQASLYVASAWKQGLCVKGILYNFLPKPTISQSMATPMEKRKYKKDGGLYANCREADETNAEYIERVREWYVEHSGPEYFRQHIVTRNEAQVEAMVQNVARISSDIRRAERMSDWYMNPAACQMLSCPYASVCLEDTPEAREANFAKRVRQDEQEANDATKGEQA